jgi:hypothetical protein
MLNIELSVTQIARLPVRYAVRGKVQGNSIRQIAQKDITWSLGPKRFCAKGRLLGRVVVDGNGTKVLVVRQPQLAEPDFSNVLVVPGGSPTSASWPTGDDLQSSRWLRPAPLASASEDVGFWTRRCNAIRQSWKGHFLLMKKLGMAPT